MRNKSIKEKEAGDGGLFQKQEMSAIANNSPAVWSWHFYWSQQFFNTKKSKGQRKAFLTPEMALTRLDKTPRGITAHYGDWYQVSGPPSVIGRWLIQPTLTFLSTTNIIQWTLLSASACRQKVNQKNDNPWRTSFHKAVHLVLGSVCVCVF